MPVVVGVVSDANVVVVIPLRDVVYSDRLWRRGRYILVVMYSAGVGACKIKIWRVVLLGEKYNKKHAMITISIRN